MKIIQRVMTAFIAMVLIFSNLITAGAHTEDGDYINFEYEISYHQQDARELLDLVNAFRTGEDAWAWNESNTEKIYYEGLQPLTYDYALERAAIIRAKEIVAMFSHTRPDGSRCFTAFESGYRNYGENIAAGLGNAETAFFMWEEEHRDYSGQGHRRNMLGDFTAMGAACVKMDGRTYWVQEFGRPVHDTNPVEYSEEKQSVTVPVLKEYCYLSLRFADFNYYMDPSEVMAEGAEMDIPFAEVYMTTDDYTKFWADAERSWSSTDESVARVEDGKIIAVGAGECDIVTTAQYLGMTGSISLHLEVQAHTHTWQLNHWDWNDDYSSAEAVFVCAADNDHIHREPAEVTSVITEATCAKEGKIVYIAKAAFEGKQYTDTKTTVLAKKPHEWGTASYEWSADNMKVTASVTCNSCGETLEETVDTSYTVTKEPTKTSVGTGTYTAVFKNVLFTAQTKDVVIPSLPDDKPYSISLSRTDVTLSTKTELKLSALLEPADADQTVTWTSNNSDIVSVDSDGTIHANRYGEALITAVSKADPGLSAVCRVSTRYYDVANESLYYFKPVYWAADEGITKGYDNVYFGPKNNCTREAVVTFLWRLAGKPEPTTKTNPFKDIRSDKYYYKAVLWAAEKGITKGYNDGTFRPDDTCLREHVVTFLWRYAGNPAPKTAKNPFNDIKASDYYYKASLWANEEKIANGYSSGEHAGGFGPKLDCLREHVVTFLYRYKN